ncbi:SCO2525 family SAM-dependent methyltransferase [Streptomyces sp. NBC_01352]|uniref:SCO2525 family SAM-dependent methyltransferase n=1 Tax=Streptomyces plumbiresistens TaxID=511811 RepID=A0ABP7T298_9ACTN|nr:MULTISPECIES: SCO2525 family SAM-dependent methyltransferase [unclassified Streptomyces]MCX4702811.1 SCO2525 family SAM-dependent methyltransferase [Streptomyces sp. NBC_01373]
MAGNSAYDWDAFDSEDYLEHNYADLHDEDRHILNVLRDFFSDLPFDSDARGVDVGTGTNLYPALAMLPFCREISLLEFSEANRKWLALQLRDYSANWDSFWQVLAEQEVYRTIQRPRERMRRRTAVRKWDILDSVPEEKWDLGTMFFVAESITTVREEFTTALGRFCALLKPGAPFAMTFMQNSSGYEVGGRHFPALGIGVTDVREEMWELGNRLEFHHIDVGSQPLREGYSGMILVHGHVK